MAECDDAAESSPADRMRRILAAYFCFRARRINEERLLDIQIEEQESESRDIEERLQASAFTVAAVMAASFSVHRERWSFQRNERWFEDTMPHLGEYHFKQAFRVSPTTFRYLVESCRVCLERQTTNMRKAISVEKRVAVGLYRLCSSAEDRTIADLFGIGRSTVNTIFREFCKTVIDRLEAEWIRMVGRRELEEHMRECFAVNGFPQVVGALDGCHFGISPPKENAADYHNYKGW